MSEKLLNYPDIFLQHIYSSFKSLANDKVINVRLTLSKVIARHWKTNGKMKNHEKLVDLLRILRKDKSKDVKFFIQGIRLEGDPEEAKIEEDFNGKLKILGSPLKIIKGNSSNRQVSGEQLEKIEKTEEKKTDSNENGTQNLEKTKENAEEKAEKIENLKEIVEDLKENAQNLEENAQNSKENVDNISNENQNAPEENKQNLPENPEVIEKTQEIIGNSQENTKPEETSVKSEENPGQVEENGANLNKSEE